MIVVLSCVCVVLRWFDLCCVVLLRELLVCVLLHVCCSCLMNCVFVCLLSFVVCRFLLRCAVLCCCLFYFVLLVDCLFVILVLCCA